ncbi:heat shock cognate 71 kDa protein-like [Styela clava]
MKAIGIDLGTTYCCVAAVRDGQLEVIANEAGNRTTPSYVAFDREEDNSVIVGDAAKHQASMNLDNTIYDIKRMIGCRFHDIVLQEDMKRWSFDVINIDNKPNIEYWDGEKEYFSPEELSAYLLEEMKKSAEDYLGEKIEKAVVTVPAQFNSAQRKATLEAGKLAGLEVIALLNEPSAAAIAYGMKNQRVDIQNILVFDFGGGTFDVTVLSIRNNIYEVKSTGGNTHLGGEDLTDRLVSYFAEEFNKENDLDMTTDKKAMDKLREKCEIVKKNLSHAQKSPLIIDSLFKHKDFFRHVTRTKFEELNIELFDETLKTVENVLAKANIDKSEIDEVALIGGSSRIPKIRQLIFEYFSKDPSKAINPDEAVALGAAVYAAHLTDDKSVGIKSIVLKDVTPLSLGVALAGGTMKVIVPRNTVIPTTEFHTFCTSEENQKYINVKIYEGERAEAKKNIRIGKFKLTDIPPAPKGKGKFTVEFHIDSDGILTVTARDKTTGKMSSVVVSGDVRASKQETARMVMEAEKHEDEDELIKTKKKLETKLESTERRIQRVVQNAACSPNLTDEQKSKVMGECNKMMERLRIEEGIGIEEVETIRKELKEFEDTINPSTNS